ncbi:hypothetical protein CA13_39190 [Planctomycetes bacterium CA13]|uniref:YcxB-like protein domain-containing protein n=1 Tax=Novipirellula herctigrandis TaxID=2527986 RepID=A0A5C5Z5V8_9BACT|nr:hypothetical protein CA13_39190 [Planctomycetes bacterium CA13]
MKDRSLIVVFECRIVAIDSSKPNPYQPAQPVDGNSLPEDILRFNGVIEPDDYRCLLPQNHSERILYLVLAALLTITILFVGSAGLFFVSTGNLLIGLANFAFCVLIGLGLWFIQRRIGKQGITRRHLKKHPDLLGTARGEFSQSGLLFNDGTYQYWFGPSRLVNVGVSKKGIRFSVDGSPYRYLAFTNRLFESYSIFSAAPLKQTWIRLANEKTTDEDPFYLDVWNQVSHPPADAIRFRGQMTLRQPMKTPQLRKQASAELVSPVLAGCLFWFARDSIHPIFLWSGIIYTVFALTVNCRTWWNYFKGTSVQVWHQHGWISPDEFASCNNESAVRMPTTKISTFTMEDNLVTLTTESGASYFIPRDHVATQEQWNRLVDLGRNDNRTP